MEYTPTSLRHGRVLTSTEKVHDLTPSQRLLIGVGGMPGSGKTTLAALVVRQLNSRYAEQAPGVATTSPIAAFVPMDGYV